MQFPWQRRKQREAELEEELQSHLQMAIRERMERGESAAEAEYAARRELGNIGLIKEVTRDMWGWRMVEQLVQDLKYGARILHKNPVFTVVTIFTLALGIGANSAIFSMIYGVLLRPLPYQKGDELVVLQQEAPLARTANVPFSVKEIADYREQNRSLADLAEHHTMSFILLGGDEPQRVETGVVSHNFFDMLGVKPVLGRAFLPSDEAHGADAVLLLSFKYWQQKQGGDEKIVGRTFRMNDRTHTVIGVLPPMPQYPSECDIFMPTSACPTRSSERFKANRNARMMTVIGRLKQDVPITQARADLAAVASNLKNAYPDSYPAKAGYNATARPLREVLTEDAKPTLLILLGTAGLVLLIACANVANLNLARLMKREQEMSVRAALGASRGRLIRQLLTESTMLTMAGGLLGLLFAAGGLRLLIAFAARFTTRADEITIDGSVLLFTLIVAIVTGLLFSLLPAFNSHQNLAGALKDSGSRGVVGTARQRLRKLLIVAQVSVSFILLIGAGLMVRSLLKLQQVDAGFNSENVLAMSISPNWSKYQQPEQYRALYQRMLDAVKTQPGVISATITLNYPLRKQGIVNGPNMRSFTIEGRPLSEGELAPRTAFRNVSTDYFQTLRMPLIQGRLFTDSDSEKALNVAVINQSMAKHRWGNEDPVGRRVSFDQGENWITIVGVVGDVKNYGLDREVVDELYRPLAQSPGANSLLVRTASDPMSLSQQLRATIYQIDPETAITDVQTLEQARAESIASPRLTTILLSLFAGLALVITVTGISGVMVLTVSQRAREIGIRMALGASHGQVLWMVMRQWMLLVMVGLAIGLAGSLALTRLMSTLLFTVQPTDPITFAAVSLVLLMIAAIACIIPARRATTIDPMIVLRAN